MPCPFVYPYPDKGMYTRDQIDQLTNKLIQECISILGKRYMGDNNREDMEVRRCMTDLKNHFGVEE